MKKIFNTWGLALSICCSFMAVSAQDVILDSDYPSMASFVSTVDGGDLSQEIVGGVTTEELVLEDGADLQAAVDSLYNRKGGNIILGAGTYVLSSPLMVHSTIHIMGDSSLNNDEVVITIVDTTFNDAMIKCEEALNNFSLTNLKVMGNLKDSEQHLDATYHSEGLAADSAHIRSDLMGILLTAEGDTYSNAESWDITMNNVEVSNCAMGIHIKGARDVYLTNMNVHHNGMIQAYYHNLYFRRVFNFTIEDSEFHNSLTGNGMNVSQSEDVTLRNNNCYDNYFRGFRIEGESGYIINNVMVEDNTATGNGFESSQPGIRIRNVTTGLVQNNTSTDNYSQTNFNNTGSTQFLSNSWQ